MENKTVVYEENTYKIDAPYLFSVYGKRWIYGILRDIDSNYSKPFCTNGDEWLYIKEIPSGTNGTIKPVPVELINGNAYMFKYHASRKPVVGVYSSGTGEFLTTQSDHSACACTDIREMTAKETK
tara:strand:+ start:176 stop:550 length:375 start_codon:yes stop_codon:yes gene_type:complete